MQKITSIICHLFTIICSKEPFGILPQGILVAVANTNRTRDLTPTKSSKEMDLGGKKQV